MGSCNCYQSDSLNPQEKNKPDYSHYKNAPTASSSPDKITRKSLNPHSDPHKKLIQQFYDQHKLDIDPEILILYMEILRGDNNSLKEVNLKFRNITPKQAKFLSLILPYCTSLRKINI